MEKSHKTRPMNYLLVFTALFLAVTSAIQEYKIKRLENRVNQTVELLQEVTILQGKMADSQKNSVESLLGLVQGFLGKAGDAKRSVYAKETGEP